ncbi:MAG: hypothetical protein LBP58_09060, partial [Azoarcus sp.]|nr:hypothetical protein [Azoarcus sp.]
MKKTLLTLALLASSGMALAEPTPQERWEETFADGVIRQSIRERACGNHRYQLAEEARAAGRELPEFKDYCGSTGLDKIDALGLVRTPAGDHALLRLWSISLGAAPAESRECMFLIRGKALLPALKTPPFDPAKARQQCLDVLKDPNSMIARDYPKANPDSVCESESAIVFGLRYIVSQIEAGKT